MEVKMDKQLKPCPICGATVGVGIITAENCNGKVYHSICCGNTCRHKLPSDWYEKRKDAVEAWNNLNTTAFTSVNCDDEKRPNSLVRKVTEEIVDVVIKQNEFDKRFLQNKICDIITENSKKLSL
jgi:hypothetical protein